MNMSGDAAEQVVMMSLQGAEVAVRLTGSGAKHTAMLLAAILKEEQKTKGKTRLTSMLKSGKELKVFTVQQKDLKTFAQEAKRYGVLYCVLKDGKTKDPTASVDIIARAEDASKLQRITEKFKLATVAAATVEAANPTLARAEKKDPLSEPDSKKADRLNGSTGPKTKPSVKEKLDGYRKEAQDKKLIGSKEKDISKGEFDPFSVNKVKPSKPEKAR